MSGPKRNPDALNTIGVVVVGICGAVLVYVSIVALQAFYMNDSSEVQTMADYGGQDTAHQSLRAAQVNVIEACAANGKPEAGKQQTYRIPISNAIKLVADGAKVDPANLVPAQGRSDKSTILPIFGRPKLAPAAAPAATPATGDASKPADMTPTPMTPTGGTGPGGGPTAGQGPTPTSGSPTGAATPAPSPASTGGNPPTPKASPAPKAEPKASPKASPKAGSASK